MNKPKEWYDHFQWQGSTQADRDEFYKGQKVMCEGSEDNTADRCGWIKKMYKEMEMKGSSFLDLACHDGYVTRGFLKDEEPFISI